MSVSVASPAAWGVGRVCSRTQAEITEMSLKQAYTQAPAEVFAGGGQSLPLHFLSIYCLPFLSISPLFPYLPSLNFSPPFPPRPLHSALPSTLRSGPLNLARVSVSSPSGVRDRALPPPPSRVRGRALAAITIQLSQKCHINTQAFFIFEP